VLAWVKAMFLGPRWKIELPGWYPASFLPSKTMHVVLHP
jgi:hypothetical protein